MKQLSLLLILLNLQSAFSQNCHDCRYLSPVFDSVSVSTVHFGEGTTSDGDLQQLYMDVYEPVGDTATKRPVVIFAFGGGFVQGSKNDWYVKEVCNYFAKAGYVAVANDYRLGIDPLEILFLQYMRIFFRPMQDMRATIQYLKADYTELGDNFRIDTARILIGGASAGAITALMTAYCDRPEELGEMGNLSALDELGGFYSTSGFYPQYSWNGLATVNVSGALINADWVETGDIPIISAHGDQDNIVPYAYGPLGGGLLGGAFDLQGSAIVHERAEEVGVCSYLYTMEGHDHPNTGMGMDYIRAVVQRIAQRAYALIHGRTFCCEMTADITPSDTLFHDGMGGTFPLEAAIQNDNGQAELLWCSMPCGLVGSAPSVTAQPDTSWETISLIAHEGSCQAQNLHIVSYEEEETAIMDIDAVGGFSCHPSPATDRAQIQFTLNTKGTENLSIDVFNLNGQKMHGQIVCPSIHGQIMLNVADWPSGSYVVSLRSSSALMATTRLMVAH